MADPFNSSSEGHARADHASSASTVPSGVGLALAPVVFGVFLMTLITGFALWFPPYSLMGDPTSDLFLVTSMMLVRVHGHFAAASLLVVPMVIARAVLLWKKSSKYAVRTVEVAAFVALLIALWDPTSLLPWRQLGGLVVSEVLSLWPAPDPPLVLQDPFCEIPGTCGYYIDARTLLNAGSLLSKFLWMRFWFFHAVLAPLALIGVGAAFIHRHRGTIGSSSHKERSD